MRTLLYATAVLAWPAVFAAAEAEMAQSAKPTELFAPGAAHVHSEPRATIAPGKPPLYQGLGDISFPVTTNEPEAQAYVDQGLRLIWGFNHAEAVRSFRAAQAIDPGCAMAAWGEAFALGPNINAAMVAEAVPLANAAAERAVALAENASELERALAHALKARYAPSVEADRATLDIAYAEAMADLAAAFPDDVDVQVLYADALMNLQPWDYWEADGLTTKGHGATILATLERALALAPRHPAALHLYIHAVEASADPAGAEAAADRLRGAAPAAGHLVHMPAHIYARVGRYADSIEVNREAVAADEAFLSQVGAAASPLYRFGYYPHNVHYLLVSAQMAGLADVALQAAEKLQAVTSDEVSAEVAWVQAIRTAPYTAHAQLSPPTTLVELPAPADGLPFVRGFWHYARGVGFALLGDVPAAREEALRLRELIETAPLDDLEAQYLPARDVLAIAEHIVLARAAVAEDEPAVAERHLRDAIALAESVPYMEPPYWYYPVSQSLGAVLLAQGRAEEAVAAFEDALEELPGNGWALFGLIEAQRAAGLDTAAAEARLDKAWLGDRTLLDPNRL